MGKSIMEEILNRLKNGDNDAFEEIVEKYELKLFYIALSRVDDEYLAHEAVQDTFVALYLNIGNLKSFECFNSWIVKILINKCNRKFRKKAFKEVLYNGVDLEHVLKDEESIGNVLDEISFLDLISDLKEDDRTLMLLYYKYDYTTKEISQILNVNENTIRTRIKRARKVIKKKIDIDDCKE